jgi:hypothetical protein
LVPFSVQVLATFSPVRLSVVPWPPTSVSMPLNEVTPVAEMLLRPLLSDPVRVTDTAVAL